MATNCDDSIEEEITKMEEGVAKASTCNETYKADHSTSICTSESFITITQKLIAEVIGTYFLIFAGCGSVTVDKIYGSVTFPGICVTWGLIVMALIYTLGHVSGAHFNPAVTITLTIFKKLPLKEAPMYILSQLMGSILASGTLAMLFEITPKSFFGTVPVGSDLQSLVMEFIISFLLMFVISGATSDERGVTELGGIAVGMTIMLNVFVGGPISGASMNPARSIGPALIKHVYKGLWVYIVGPIIGCLAGGFAYNLLRYKELPNRGPPNGKSEVFKSMTSKSCP